MNIGDILKKMGAASLTGAEQEAVRLWGNETQMNNSLSLRTGGGKINVDEIYANRVTFGDMPFEGVRLMRDATQSIATATYTKIQFDTVTYQKNQSGYPFFDMAVSNTDIYIKKTGIYAFAGDVRFTANATGMREVEILSSHTPYEDGAGGRGRVGMASGGGDEFVGTVLSFAGMFSFTIGDTVSVSVWQNTGGALTVDNIRFGIYRIQ